jgi:hypothetical protein
MGGCLPEKGHRWSRLGSSAPHGCVRNPAPEVSQVTEGTAERTTLCSRSRLSFRTCLNPRGASLPSLMAGAGEGSTGPLVRWSITLSAFSVSPALAPATGRGRRPNPAQRGGRWRRIAIGRSPGIQCALTRAWRRRGHAQGSAIRKGGHPLRDHRRSVRCGLRRHHLRRLAQLTSASAARAKTIRPSATRSFPPAPTGAC